ncbi:LANO_0C05072g1_1 [Lachancea nothofagi CBS 11611]|uniref:LANO_0C05072g1_1 n=1 Tax=Lachancea nothofagi CBS 11611 TaxID=1266666 RepID=A0A1G4J768_9SACH|nr:LANO_0C05072g1_1 [Lachancea nothofagi CBS 11611]
MKLKLIINGSESPEDYKLLRSTISTVASLRKTAVLRFTSERLVIVSTPSSSTLSSSVLHGDNGQLWCTIPKDVFSSYEVVSARDLNTITMECSCDVLQNIFKKYDKSINQGNDGDMTIKLQSMPEWNVSVSSNLESGKGTTAAKTNPVCALGVTFEEVINTNMDANAAVKAGGHGDANATKIISHSFKVPTKLLFRAQDAKIREPMINYTQLMMYRLPTPLGEWGRGFQSFIRRIERYSNVHNIKLSGKKFWQDDSNHSNDHELKIIVNELDWYLEICWNGPLDAMIQPQDRTQEPPASPAEQMAVDVEIDVEETRDQSLFIEESASIDDSHAETTVDANVKDKTVDQTNNESPSKHEVVIRSKDWKVCSKLYEAFEEIVLAISHDESCVFHCTLPRGNVEDEEGEHPREHGQVIYYMARVRKV